MLQKNMIPCKSNEAVVTVLSYCDGNMDGYLQHPRLDREEKIHSLSQMILLLDNLLGLEGCPGKPLPVVSSTCSGQDSIAVFRIQILFQEHHTWQGRLVWQDENRETVFHSALTLLQLLDEILVA